MANRDASRRSDGTEIALLALPAAILWRSRPRKSWRWCGRSVACRLQIALAAPCDTVNRPPPRALGAAWRHGARRPMLLGRRCGPAATGGSPAPRQGPRAGAVSADVAGAVARRGASRAAIGARAPGSAGARVERGAGAQGRTPGAAALGAEILACGAAASLAVWYAPGFARPAFPGWALANLPFDAVGRPGRWLEPALAALARRHGR